jgi:hypothetical protein
MLAPDGATVAAAGMQFLIVDEDGLVSRDHHFPGSSRELKGPQCELKGARRRFSHSDRRDDRELGAAA